MAGRPGMTDWWPDISISQYLNISISQYISQYLNIYLNISLSQVPDCHQRHLSRRADPHWVTYSVLPRTAGGDLPGVSEVQQLTVSPVLVACLLGEMSPGQSSPGGVSLSHLLPGRGCRLLPSYPAHPGPEMSPTEDHQPQGLAETLQTERSPRPAVCSQVWWRLHIWPGLQRPRHVRPVSWDLEPQLSSLTDTAGTTVASPTSDLTSWPWSTLSPTPPVSRSCWRAPSSQPSSSRRLYSPSPVGRTLGKPAVYYLPSTINLPSMYHLLSTIYNVGVCIRDEITSCSCTPPPRSARGRDWATAGWGMSVRRGPGTGGADCSRLASSVAVLSVRTQLRMEPLSGVLYLYICNTEVQLYNIQFSGVQCQKCEGLLLPLNSLDCKSVWKCLKCGAEFSADFIESLIMR